MLKFYGTAYDKDLKCYDFEIKAFSEKEAKEKIKAKYLNRKKPIRLTLIDLYDVDIVPKIHSYFPC